MGLGEVDNPAVPNLISVGTVQARSALTSHGTSWFELSNAVALALPQNSATLSRRANAAQNHDYLSISKTTLVDVVTYDYDDPTLPSICAPAVGANIDAAPTMIPRGALIGTSFQRSRVPGLNYLRRSRSSARDFSVLPATLFVVP
jgi:hypothetical protein